MMSRQRLRISWMNLIRIWVLKAPNKIWIGMLHKGTHGFVTLGRSSYFCTTEQKCVALYATCQTQCKKKGF